MNTDQGGQISNRNRRTGFIALGAAAGMLALGYASVPLYRLFCQVTGFQGTTQRATVAQADAVRATDRPITIRFDGNVDPDLPWYFRPERTTDQITVGERDMAIYVARNDSREVITGAASFNVSPEQAGKYFQKIQCFCFTEQTLKPGEEVRMPVLFYVDPEILEDDVTKNIEHITLSYSFHRSKEETEQANDPT